MALSALPPLRKSLELVMKHAPYRIEQNWSPGVMPPAFANNIPQGDGIDHFARFSAMHAVLAQNSPQPLRVVENGPGITIGMDLHMVRRGDRLTIKEPAELVFRIHKERLREALGELAASSIIYCDSLEAVDKPSPADIVYWPNPSFSGIFKEEFDTESDLRLQARLFMQTAQLDDMTVMTAIEKNYENIQQQHNRKIAVYLSRDVVIGGFLIVQSDTDFNRVASGLAPEQWEAIYLTRQKFDECVLPTTNGASQFGIWRRLA